MCGIAGYYSAAGLISREELELMTRALAHRGPDSEGFFVQDKVGLGHRRLSILDLSTAAGQPFYSSDGRYVIVFNGEIYNYRELAARHNLKLHTTSDTEVLVELFAKLGQDMVKELNGMFAFAIYDLQTNKMFLFRDRLGVKPLYYLHDGGQLIFSSELKSITKVFAKKMKLRVNKLAINQFLHLGYIPEPYSIWDNIKKFPAGSTAVFHNAELTIQPYWVLNEKIGSEILSDEKIAKDRLRELLFSSVQYRMISDVPLGTFLSGGIDSSLVTAVAGQLSTQPVNTFSIGFKDAKFNEASYASAIAKQLHTNHHELYITEKEAQEHLLEIIDHYDEPYADSSALPTWLVSKFASNNVTVALSGDGGDELFMGYGAYTWAERLSNPLLKLFRKPASIALNLTGSNRNRRVASLIDFPNEENIRSHIFSQEQYYFSQKEVADLIQPHYRKEFTLDYTNINIKRKLTPMEKQSLFDMQYYLKDDLLVKVDRASMKASIEAREPLLDYRLFEFSLNLSPELKIKNGKSKWLLKEILFEMVPASLYDRPKWGFGIPLGSWMKGKLSFMIEDYLSEKAITETGILNYESVEKLKRRFFKGEDYLYNRLWQLIVLQRWWMKNVK